MFLCRYANIYYFVLSIYITKLYFVNALLLLALIYALLMIISVSYWFIYETAQRGRRYINSSASNLSPTPQASTDNKETIKFGTRYGAVVN